MISTILDWVWSILTNKWIILHNIICYILVEWSFRKITPLYKKSKEQEIRDKKFPSFIRRDNIKRPLFYLLAPTLIFRLLIGYGGIACVSILIFFISLTHKRGTPYTGWKFSLISTACTISARITLAGVGIFKINEQKVDIDYKKYLGPDWKPDPKGFAGTIISNHQSWVDIIVHMYR